MDKQTAGKLIIDGLHYGYLKLSWNMDKKDQSPQSYHDVINKSQELGLLIEVCAGCGEDTSNRDCGCPCGTNLRWKA